MFVANSSNLWTASYLLSSWLDLHYNAMAIDRCKVRKELQRCTVSAAINIQLWTLNFWHLFWQQYCRSFPTPLHLVQMIAKLATCRSSSLCLCAFTEASAPAVLSCSWFSWFNLWARIFHRRMKPHLLAVKAATTINNTPSDRDRAKKYQWRRARINLSVFLFPLSRFQPQQFKPRKGPAGGRVSSLCQDLSSCNYRCSPIRLQHYFTWLVHFRLRNRKHNYAHPQGCVVKLVNTHFKTKIINLFIATNRQCYIGT